MFRIFLLLPLTACVLYDSTGKCASCEGRDGLDDRPTTAIERADPRIDASSASLGSTGRGSLIGRLNPSGRPAIPARPGTRGGCAPSRPR